MRRFVHFDAVKSFAGDFLSHRIRTVVGVSELTKGLLDDQRRLDEELTAENLGLLHGDAVIEPGGSDEDGEFSPSEFDAESLSNVSDSTSLNSSILQHSFVNGRRYHRYRHGRYPIPNDDTEQHREDMLHTMMLEATDGKLYYAPIGNHIQKIIDLGTGTGLWAMDSKFCVKIYIAVCS
jgi:hypothetical protein